MSADIYNQGASAVILGGVDAKGVTYEALDKALTIPETEVRLFAKPEAFVKRRMGVALAAAKNVKQARENALKAANLIKVKVNTID